MLKHLKVWQKLTIMSLSFGIPIAMLLLLVVRCIDSNVRFAQWEQYGNAYQRPLEKLLQHLIQHKFLTYRALSDAQSRTDELVRLRATIDEDFVALEVVDRTLHGPLQTTQEGLAKRKR